MHCTRRKLVYSKKLHKKVRRCVSFSGRTRGRKSRRRAGYRRGHRPFNKGKHCVAYALNKRGVRSCVSYGGSGARKSRLFGPALPRTSHGKTIPASMMPYHMRSMHGEGVDGLSGYGRRRRCVKFGRKHGRRVCRKYGR